MVYLCRLNFVKKRREKWWNIFLPVKFCTINAIKINICSLLLICLIFQVDLLLKCKIIAINSNLEICTSLVYVTPTTWKNWVLVQNVPAFITVFQINLVSDTSINVTSRFYYFTCFIKRLSLGSWGSYIVSCHGSFWTFGYF